MPSSSFITKLVSVISGLLLSAALIIFIPYLSGSMQEDEIIPMLVINSIDFHKEIIQQKKELKKKQKIVKKKPKKAKNKIKKAQRKVVKKKQVIKPIEKNFSTKKKQVEKLVQAEDEEIPEPEPIYRITEKPYFLKAIKPIYPTDMYDLGKTAVVTVDALIDRKGKVRKTTIYKSAGKSFDDAAITAVKESIFVPGKIGGKPVAVMYRMKINFDII